MKNPDHNQHPTRLRARTRALGAATLGVALLMAPKLWAQQPSSAEEQRSAEEARLTASAETGEASPDDGQRPQLTVDQELARLVARPGGLTAHEAAERAVSTSYQIAAAEAREHAAQSSVSAARARYSPRVTLMASYQRLSPVESPSLGTVVVAPGADAGLIAPTQVLVAAPFSFPSLENQTNLRAQLLVPLTDYFLRYPQALGASRQGRSRARYEREATLARTRTEAQIAYYSWARATLQCVVAEQASRRARLHRDDIERMHLAGLATNADLQAVEAQLARADLTEVRAKNQAAISEDRLKNVLHLPPDAQLSIGEDLLAVPAPQAIPPLEQGWREARQRRPELMALDAAQRQFRRQADSLRGAELPRVDATAEVLTANPNPRYQPPLDEFKTTWAVGVQATWTVTDLPQRRAERAALVAQADAVGSDRDALADAIRSEVVEASRILGQSGAALEAARRSATAAQIAYDVRLNQHRAGTATSVELTDAETELTAARVDFIDALLDVRIAAVRLDYALGRAAPQASDPSRTEPQRAGR